MQTNPTITQTSASPQKGAKRETFLKMYHVFTGQELEEMWKVVALAASENTAKQMYEAFYETDKVVV